MTVIIGFLRGQPVVLLFPILGLGDLLGRVWLSRYETVPASSEDHAMAYQLDRWTGAGYLLGASENGRVCLQDK